MSEGDKLDLILERLTGFEKVQKELVDQVSNLAQGQKDLAERVSGVETGQKDLEKGQKDLTNRVSNLEEGQKALKAGQRELKEISDAIRYRQDTADAKRERMHDEMTSGFALMKRDLHHMENDQKWMTVKITEHDEEIEHLKS